MSVDFIRISFTQLKKKQLLSLERLPKTEEKKTGSKMFQMQGDAVFVSLLLFFSFLPICLQNNKKKERKTIEQNSYLQCIYLH